MDSDYNWSLVYDKFVPEQEGLREALCTLGNGYFATRGAFPEMDADEHHYPGTYLAGGYNRLKTEIMGRVIENEDLVNMPNWLSLKFRIEGGDWFHLLSFKQELNLKEGILKRRLRFRDAQKRETTLEQTQLVHMRHPHLAAVKTSLTAENWSGKIEILSALDGRVKNDGVPRYRELNSIHLEPVVSGMNECEEMCLKVQTSQSELRIAQAARNKIFLNGKLLSTEPLEIAEEGYVAAHYTVPLKEKECLSIEKTLAIYTSRDRAISEPCLKAKQVISRAPSFSELVRTQALAWKALWDQFDMEIEVSTAPPERTRSLLVLRLHIFHLLQTASFNTTDLDVGVPARGWHGEAYRGHIFWDELFIFPILNLRIPKITLALLRYRYRRLDEAREAAKKAGFAGAMFPWQSSSDGREESQQLHLNPKSGRWLPDHSYIQRHVNLAIAYNAWRFFEVSNDMDYLHSVGAEIILEISRFFVSLCSYNSELDRYEIHHVMGPDEYHDAYPGSKEPGLNNNAYTNIMTVWVLTRALEILSILPQDHHRELCEMLDLEEKEVQEWHDISRKMRVVFHDGGIISQFEGYDKLKEFPWDEYREKYGDIQRLDRILEAEEDSPNNYKLSKQADVLMLFYLFSTEELVELFGRLGYEFSGQLIPKNIDYYLNRTSHGSTLSRIVHSWVLSREDRPASWDLFVNALESDVADIQGGTTPEGIHLGSMAGTVDIIQRCYAGIEPKGDILWLNPCLPEALKRLRFHVHYRGHSIEIEMNHEKLKVRTRFSIAKSIWVGVQGKTYELQAGETHEFSLAEKKRV